jgi:hypothetical protein
MGVLKNLSSSGSLTHLQGGSKALRGIDYATHESLIREHAFQTYTLPKRAEELSRRLLNALAVFFPPSVAHWAEGDFANLAHDEGVRIKEFMSQALELKSKLILSPDKCNLLTFEPGTPYDPETMCVEEENGAAVNELPNSPSTVKLCLFPALFLCPSQKQAVEDIPEGDDFSHLLVSYHTFTAFSPIQETERRLISKAVVLLGE